MIDLLIEHLKFKAGKTLRSYTEKEDAENAAWNAPGVTAVTNNLEIEVPEYEPDY